MAPLSANQLNKLFKSRQILIEILKMRGFTTDNYSDFSFQEFSAQFSNEQLDMLVESDESPDGKEETSETEETTKKVYIKYHLEGKLTNKIIYNTVEDLFEADEVLDKKTDEIIIVSNQKPNKTIMEIKDTLFNTQGILINVLHYNSLQTNILNNTLVPKHTVLSEVKKQEVMKKYNIQRNDQFPEIDRHEPVSCILGIRPGQLVEIERNSPTALTSLYYRICV